MLQITSYIILSFIFERWRRLAYFELFVTRSKYIFGYVYFIFWKQHFHCLPSLQSCKMRQIQKLIDIHLIYLVFHTVY